jgi:hypothetical protein
MKKMLIFGLVVTTIMSGMVFAGTEATGTDSAADTAARPGILRPRADDAADFNIERPLNVDERGERRQMLLSAAFETYAPELLDTYTALEETHRAFHEARNALRETALEDQKAAYNDIFEALLSGEMEREDAQAAVQVLRDSGAKTREALKAILEEKNVALEADKAANDALRDTLKSLLTADTVDEEAVHEALEQVIVQLQDHIALDEKYAVMVDEVLEP